MAEHPNLTLIAQIVDYTARDMFLKAIIYYPQHRCTRAQMYTNIFLCCNLIAITITWDGTAFGIVVKVGLFLFCVFFHLLIWFVHETFLYFVWRPLFVFEKKLIKINSTFRNNFVCFSPNA